MPPGGAAAGPRTGLTFINSSTETSVRDNEERKRNKRLVRVHAAKLIRQRQRSQRYNAAGSAPTRSPITPDSEQVGHEDRSNSQGNALALPRTISPAFGGLSIDTFDLTTSDQGLETANYCLNFDWPNLLTPEQATGWFDAFCKHPVIYHGFIYASAAHQDMLSNQIVKTNRPDMLAHKLKALRLLGELISQVDEDPAKLELVLLAISIMWHYDLTKDQIKGDCHVLQFSPHMPGANWLAVSGRTRGVEAHARALGSLLDRLGGIGKLKDAGLASAISLGDLIAASISFEKPSLPIYWTNVPPLSSILTPLHPSPTSSGAGFSTDVPGGLPPKAEAVLQYLCAVDQLMAEARHRRVDSTNARYIVDARNAAQHQLLALPAWGEMNAVERHGCRLATYECCRITAVLYANSVLFPLPTNTGWHKGLVKKLRTLLETANMGEWHADVLPLLIWSLFVGGIASYRSVDREFFEDALRDALLRAGLLTWPAVEERLGRFLWSRVACEVGAAILWDALEIDDFLVEPSPSEASSDPGLLEQFPSGHMAMDGLV